MNAQPTRCSPTLNHRRGGAKGPACVKAKRLVAWLVLLLPLLVPAGEQSLARSREPIGELITSGDGIVKINGVRAVWGTVLFSGSEIQTTASMAFVRLTGKAGVLSISPNSRVRVSRTGSKTVVRVFHGDVTIRSDSQSQVEAPDRTVNSTGDDVYSVSVSEKETKVQALKRPLQVLAGAAVAIVAPEIAGAVVAKTFQPDRARPAPARVAQTTERPNLLIECRAEKLFNHGLRVVGKVTNDLTPVGSVPVMIRIMFRNRFPAINVTNVVTGTSGSMLGYFQTILAASNADLTAGGVVEVAAQVDREIVGNRCSF